MRQDAEPGTVVRTVNEDSNALDEASQRLTVPRREARPEPADNTRHNGQLLERHK